MPAIPQAGDVAGRVGILSQAVAIGLAEASQRALVLGVDILLIVSAIVAMGQDWNHFCDENLHAYGLLCIVLSSLDIVWEMVRCSSESALDRLQEDFGAFTSSTGEEGLLANTPTVGLHEDSGRSPHSGGGSGSASTSSGAIGHGVRKEKLKRQKRVTDLHFWSLVFSVSVAIMFSFFSRHDEDCRHLVPSLYLYIHAFTYVYIFRLGAVLVWICCRKVKDYEDAAAFAGGLTPGRSPMNLEVEMAASGAI